MTYREYPRSFLEKLEKTIAQVKTYTNEPLIAAFDADGTLWDEDFGETFSKYQFQHKLLPNLPPDPWSYYRGRKENGRELEAYLWLAQINAGQTLEQVRVWAEDCYKSMEPVAFFPAQKNLVKYLQDQGVTVYVVTASIKWSVEPAALRLGIPYENVLGVRTQIKNGIVTDQVEGEITWARGKARELLRVTGGVAPIFSCGNTLGDLYLLEIAKELPWAVRSAVPGEELFSAEDKLSREATRRGWIQHWF